MKIREMFEEDIERPINGVVQVEQEQESVVKQEVKEYVVTTELKKHFAKFFNEYSESFDEPTNNVGVWITGFFGSGKSSAIKSAAPFKIFFFILHFSFLITNYQVSVT